MFGERDLFLWVGSGDFFFGRQGGMGQLFEGRFSCMIFRGLC